MINIDMLDVVAEVHAMKRADPKRAQELLDELRYNELMLQQDQSYGLDPLEELVAAEDSEE